MLEESKRSGRALRWLLLATALVTIGGCTPFEASGTRLATPTPAVAEQGNSAADRVWTWDIPTPTPTPRSYMCDCILTQIPTPTPHAVLGP